MKHTDAYFTYLVSLLQEAGEVRHHPGAGLGVVLGAVEEGTQERVQTAWLELEFEAIK